MSFSKMANYDFSQIPKAEIQRSAFKRPHGYKTTFYAGYLIPFYRDQVYPGDTFRAKTTIFARTFTPIHPIMDNLYLSTFYFYVPNRLVWYNWQAFMGERDTPTSISNYLTPTITCPEGGFAPGSIHDYFALPTNVENLENISVLFHRAYNKIWNQWFRDENLQEPAIESGGEGPDSANYYGLLKRGKRHDYFTSCLPWPQKGDAVEMPLGNIAPVYGYGSLGLEGMVDGLPEQYGLFTSNNTTFALAANTMMYDEVVGGGTATGYYPLDGIAMGVVRKPGASGLYADLSTATAATVNQLREAMQIQKLLERDARGGTRYTEIIRSHFGVTSPDGRLQRAEYLGGSCSRININPVQQTSNSVSGSPQGNLAAYGVVHDSSGGFSKSFTEHGMVIGLACVHAENNYQQGINRMFLCRDRYDYYWPSLAHLGEEPVLNKEIYAQGSSVVDENGAIVDEKAFGYQERWAYLKHYPSEITGMFRSNHPTPLDSWHLAYDFGSCPELNDEFIEEDPPVFRTQAVQSEPHILFDSYMDLWCARPMPLYCVPGWADHF